MVRLNLINDKVGKLFHALERVKHALQRRDWEGAERILRAAYLDFFGKEIGR